jgi:capsular exopolysaccharide synthesis family protein
MERIKQALEKARSEREKAGTGTGPGAVRTSSGARAPNLIAYTHTRTIEVADDLLREKRIISGIEQNSFTDAYKILRTQVLQRLKENGWNSVAITSPGFNEGKTLTAINLAISLAMEVDYTVLLVDADLRNPSIQSYFGLGTEKGLSEYLTDNIPLDELLIHPAHIPRFVVLPGGKSLINSSEMLNSPKMVRLVEEVKTRYPSRIIIFDLPPLLSAADALVFSPYVDAALLVIEEGKTQTEDAKRAVGLLQGTNLIGTVLNKSWTKLKDGENKTAEWYRHLAAGLQSYCQPMKQWFSRMRKGKS